MLGRSLLLLAALPLCADGLGDLRATLGRLQGAEPVKVAFDYQFWREIREGKTPELTQGAVTAQVEDGPHGLRITWDRATLTQAEAELQTVFQDPSRPAPVSQIMRSLTALDINEHMHGAQSLARSLTGAQLLETRVESWQGRPAKVLVLRLEAVINPTIRKAVHETQATGWVWLAPDGTPLAFRSDVSYGGSRFLIHFRGTQKEELHFACKGNRLLLTWGQNEESTSGLGDSVATKRIYKLTIN